jgi:hypothetical protein
MPRQHQFLTKVEAEAEKQGWKNELPRVQPAYQPSGKLPQEAISWMTGGVVLGIPAGALAGVAVGAAGTLLSVGMVALLKEIKGGRGTIMLGLATVAVVLGTFFGMFAVLGMVASHLTFLAGKRGKNRSRFASVVLAVVSALLALAPFWMIMSTSPEYVDSRDTKEALSGVFGAGDFGIVCLVIGAIVAAVAAAVYANKKVKTAKFCETCELFMEAAKPRPVSYAGVKQAAASLGAGKVEEAAASLSIAANQGPEVAKPIEPQPVSFAAVPEAVTALSSSKIDTAATALAPVAATEQEGSVELFHCPRCRAGFVEIKLTFAAQWPKAGKAGQNETMAETWMCVSKALPPGGVDTLAKVAEQKPPEPAAQAAG